MNISFITGGAGFVAANLVPRLLAEGRHVVCVDNLVRGKLAFLEPFMASSRLTFIEADLADRASCARAFETATQLGTIDEVWHLAANSDIPAGVNDPDIDHKDTFLTTFEVLRCMKQRQIRILHFASSSAIYGNLGDLPLHEAVGPVLPISNYGAMKLASEAQISAAAESFLMVANLFRFPNVVGVPATHGVIVDFIRRLRDCPKALSVLGNGTQQKAYLHVSDLVDAMLHIRSHQEGQRLQFFNIGPTDLGVTVKWIAQTVVTHTYPNAEIHFGSEGRGWVGDVPKFSYIVEKLAQLGWAPALDSAQAVTRAVQEIAAQEGITGA